MPTDDRSFDLVVFGATGFTGALTAAYLAQHAPASTRIALAGRNRAKLEAVRERLAAVNSALAGMELLHADVTDAGSVAAVAKATRVVITTVGPYINYGEPLVAACAEHGTDYVDLTGEPEFVDAMYVRHHARAEASGARIVHCCGFDSIPHDLGVLFTVAQLPDGVPVKVEGFVRVAGTFSGGTYHSAVTAFSRARQFAKVHAERGRMERRADAPGARRVRGIRGGPHRESEIGAWAVPFPTIDPQIVLRSARALPSYGPDFAYGHYLSVKRLPVAVAGMAGVGALFALSQLPPARRLLLKAKAPGDGPTEAQRARAWFNVRFVGEGGGERVVTEVTGGDPGYSETAKMLAESALCLAHDPLPATAGQVTTAQAMGSALTDRCQRAGIGFARVG